MFSKIYFKALALPTLIVALYTSVMVFFVAPQIEERVINLEEITGKTHLQEIATVVESTARELRNYHENSIISHKEKLKDITDVAFTLVEELYASSQPAAVKQHLLSEVQTFKKALFHFYQNNKGQTSKADMQKFLKEFVSFYRYDGGTGYFFINRKTRNILHPIKPSLQGQDLTTLHDEDGNYFIQNFVSTIELQNEGFVSYKWLNPTSNKVENKLTYVFYFAPFDWIIGTGLYLDEITQQKQQKALDYVANLRYGDNEYFYISDFNSVLISHPSMQGRDMSEVRDPEGILIVPPMVKLAREKGEAFHSYSWNKLGGNGKLYKKLTFAKLIPDWQWIIGTGVYLDRIEEKVEEKKAALINNLRTLLTHTKIADTGYIYIFDSMGNMVLHPNSNIEGKNFLELKNPGKNSFIFDDLLAAYNSPQKVLYYVWDKPNDKGNYSYDKVSWITYNKDFDWYICSSAYIDEINATGNALKQQIWIISFILLILAVVASAIFFKRLLRPIETLSHKAIQVKQGDLSVRSHEHGSDEIGTLAQTFDDMLDTIEENIHTLDKKVFDRTKDLHQMIRKLDYLASHDPMTGIYNRRKFFERANQEFIRDPKNIYAAMMDIDKFKKINDLHGHPVGDLVIKSVTATISACIMEETIFGRIGGEEFALVCRTSSLEEATSNLEKIRKKIAKLEIEIGDGTIINCTISIGLIRADDTIKNLDELLHQADHFLYQAKGQGRNKTVFRI
jgi:diguanylate cyclase (GGDEF)-like protein